MRWGRGRTRRAHQWAGPGACARGGRLAQRGGGGGGGHGRRAAPQRGPRRLRGPGAALPPRPPPRTPHLRPRDGRARRGLAPGPGRAAAAAAAAGAAGGGRAGGAGPRRRREDQLPPRRRPLLAQRRQPAGRGQRARRAEGADQAHGEVCAWRGRVPGRAVEAVGRDPGRPRPGCRQHVAVPEPGGHGRQPRPRRGVHRRADAGLLVPVAGAGPGGGRHAPAVRPLLLGGARGALLAGLRVRAAQARGRAPGRRPAALLRGGRLLHDGPHGALLAPARRARARPGGEAGAAGRPGAAAQHPPEPRAGGPGRRGRRQVTPGRPAAHRARARHARAPPAAEAAAAAAGQPQTLPIKVPGPAGAP